MAEDSTTPRECNVSSIYRAGDTIVFKYEGNMRACVTGHRLIDGRVWIEADAASVNFLIPASQIIGVEPREED
jgi:hypothetical protein